MNKLIEADFLPQKRDGAPDSPLNDVENKRRRILIVDNDRDSTHRVKILLEKTGNYFVREENDSTRAHQAARNLRPDLILLDIMMPEADEGEIAARIKADPELRTTPIIFLTALVTKSEAEADLHIRDARFWPSRSIFPI